MSFENYSTEEILAAISYDEIREEAKRMIRAAKAKNFLFAILISGATAIPLGFILFFPYTMLLEANRRSSTALYPPTPSLGEVVMHLYFFSFLVVVLIAVSFILPSENDSDSKKIAAEAYQRAQRRAWDEDAPKRFAAAIDEQRRAEQAERERQAQAEEKRRKDEAARWSAYVENAVAKAIQQSDQARKVEAENVAKAVFTRLADFALARTIQAGPRDPRSVARAFAEKELPRLEVQFGDRLGIAREAPLASLPANAELACMLPDPPPYRVDRQFFPENLRQNIRVEYFRSPIGVTYVADKSQALDVDDPRGIPASRVLSLPAPKPTI